MSINFDISKSSKITYFKNEIYLKTFMHINHDFVNILNLNTIPILVKGSLKIDKLQNLFQIIQTTDNLE